MIYSVMHVLACTHGRRSVTGITGVGLRPTPKPPAGARMKGAQLPDILVLYITSTILSQGSERERRKHLVIRVIILYYGSK